MKLKKLVSFIFSVIILFTSILPAGLFNQSVEAQDRELEFGKLQIESKVTEPALLGNTSDLLITLTNIGSAEVFNSTIIMHLPSGLSLKEGIPIDKRIDTDIIYPTYRGIDYEKAGYDYKLIWSNIADLRPGESVSVAVRLNVAGMPDLFVGDALTLKLRGEASQTPIYLVSDGPAIEVEDEFDIVVKGFTVNTEPSDQSEIVTGTTEETIQERIVEINSNSEIDSNGELTIREILSGGIEFVRDSISLKQKPIDAYSENIEHSFTKSVNEEGSTVLEWTLTKLMKNLPVRLSYLFGIKKDIESEIIQHDSVHTIENETSAAYIGRDEELVSVSSQSEDTYIAKYIRITKTADRSEIQPGDIVTYTVSIQTSEYYDFSNLIVEDTIPDGMIFISSSPSDINMAVTPADNGTTEINWGIGILEKKQTFTFTYQTYVKEIYESGDEVLTNDKFNNKVEVVGDWSDSVDFGTVEDQDSEITPIQRPKVKMQVWNPKVGDWRNSIRSNTGYDVSFKIESTFPNYVPSGNVSLITALHEAINIYPESIRLFINEGPLPSLSGLTLSNESTIRYQSEEIDPGTVIRIEFTANVDSNSGLQNWDALRNLTRLTYHNSEDERFNAYGQSSLYIENPDLGIEINDNATYTRTDLINRFTELTLPDTSFENYIRFMYCDTSDSCNESDLTEWVPRNEITEEVFDFLINPDLTGEKTICAQVKDQLDHESKIKCDSIFYDDAAPVGTLQVTHENSSQVNLSTRFNDPVLDDGSPGSGVKKISLTSDGQNWTTYEDVEGGTLNIESFDTGVQYGQVTIYMILEDNAGNISQPIQKTILISNPDQPELPLYVIEYDIKNELKDFVEPGEMFTIDMDVRNKGSLVWQPMKEGISNPVNISYHWINADTLEPYYWNGNRALLSRSVAYNGTHEDISLDVVAPDSQGRYILQIDAVHEGVTWFSLEGNPMPMYEIEVISGEEDSDITLPPYDREDDFGHGFIPEPNVSGISDTANTPITLYNAPDENFDYSAIFPRNIPHTVLKETNVGGTLWQNIELQDGRTGWVAIGQADSDSNSNLYIRAHVCHTRSVELRFSPSWSSNAVTVLSLGSELMITDRTSRSDGKWIQVVTTTGFTGWVSEQFICEGEFKNTDLNPHENDFFQRPYVNPSIAPDGSSIDPDGDGYYDVPITSDFGERWGRFHTGVDYGLYCRTDVLASADGIVTEVFTLGVSEGNESTLTTPGNYIIIRHEMNGNMYESWYWHLEDVFVTDGQQVTTGDTIGTVGNTGFVRGNPNSDVSQQGCHLHFEIRKVNDEGIAYPIDPELLLQYGEVDSPTVIEIGEAYDLELGIGAPLISPQVASMINNGTILYRLYNQNNEAHLYTISKSEKDQVMQLPGWSYEGSAYVVGLASNSPGGCNVFGTSRVYRFFHKFNGSHFYTINIPERDSVIQNLSNTYAYEGPKFCAFTAYQPGAAPVYRLFNPNSGYHLYTVSSGERDHLLSQGVWNYERIAYYVATNSQYGRKIYNSLTSPAGFGYSNGVESCESFKFEVHTDSGQFIGDVWINLNKSGLYLVPTRNNFRDTYYRVPDHCADLWMPTMQVATAATSPQGNTGQYQFFERGGIYYNSSYNSTYAVYGEIFKRYENEFGGTDGYLGFPVGERYWEDEQEMNCQEFEGGWLCDRNWTHPCQPGMVRYQNPNDPNDMPCAKINDFPYINQALDSTGGGYKTPEAGTVMCGANSVVMAAAGMGKIPYKGFDDLKTYTYEDNDISVGAPAVPHCDWINDVFDGDHMYNVTGSWSYVGNDWEDEGLSMCAASVWGYMESYIAGINIQTTLMDGQTIFNLGKDEYMINIKNVIDGGGGSIQGLSGNMSSGGIYEHIVLIVGYTDDNGDGLPDRIIVNDPWTNIYSDNNDYTLNGMGAIYEYQYTDLMGFGSNILFN